MCWNNVLLRVVFLTCRQKTVPHECTHLGVGPGIAFLCVVCMQESVIYSGNQWWASENHEIMQHGAMLLQQQQTLGLVFHFVLTVYTGPHIAEFICYVNVAFAYLEVCSSALCTCSSSDVMKKVMVKTDLLVEAKVFRGLLQLFICYHTFPLLLLLRIWLQVLMLNFFLNTK